MTQPDRNQEAGVVQIDDATSMGVHSRVRAETLGVASVLVALFGPALAYADGWVGGHSIFKFLLLSLGGAGALACAGWLESRPAEHARLRRALAISVAAYVGWVGLAALLSGQVLLGITGARPYWDGFATALAAGGCFAFAFRAAGRAAGMLRRWLSNGAAWTAVALAAIALAAWIDFPGTQDMIKAGRLGSAIGQPTFLGLFCAMWLPWLLHASRTARAAVQTADDAEASRQAGRSFALFATASVASVVLLLASQSRAAVVAAVVGVSVYFALAAKSPATRRRRLGAAAVLVLLATLLALGLRDPELIETGPGEFASRFAESGRGVAWDAALKATSADPLLGSGPGTFEYAYAANMTPELFAVEEGTRLLDAHNWYLTASGTAGIPAALGAIAIASLCVTGAVRSRGRASFRLAACSGAVACCAGAVFTPNGIVTLPALLVLATVGVTSTQRAEDATPASTGASREGGVRRKVLRALAVVGAALLMSWGVRVTAAEILYEQSFSVAARAETAHRLVPETTEYAIRYGEALLAAGAQPQEVEAALSSAYDRLHRDGIFVSQAGTLLARSVDEANLTGTERDRLLGLAIEWTNEGSQLLPHNSYARDAYLDVLLQTGYYDEPTD